MKLCGSDEWQIDLHEWSEPLLTDLLPMDAVTILLIGLSWIKGWPSHSDTLE